MKNKQIELMGKGPVTKAILKLSLPVVFGMMVQVFYNLVDTFFIGKLNDQNQLAAANITTPDTCVPSGTYTFCTVYAVGLVGENLGSETNNASKLRFSPTSPTA